MLIKTDTNQEPIQAEDRFRRSRLESQKTQSAHESRETATVAAAGDGMDVTNPAERMGRAMSAWAIQEKLQKIRPFLVFERSNADSTKTGIYIRSPHYSPDLYKGHLMFVCGMESGERPDGRYMVPEFSIKVPEYKSIPDPHAPGGHRQIPTMKCEIRGWRSVLAVLLKSGIVSAYDIEHHFQVSLGRDSEHWQQLLDAKIEINTQVTEEINVGNERTDGGDQGEAGQDGERGGTDDAGSGDGEVGSGGVLSGRHDENDGADGGRTSEAGRRDTSNPGGRESPQAGVDASDDHSGERGDRRQESALGQL